MDCAVTANRRGTGQQAALRERPAPARNPPMILFRHKSAEAPLWKVMLAGLLLAAQITLAPVHQAAASVDAVDGEGILAEALLTICTPEGRTVLPGDAGQAELAACSLCVFSEQPGDPVADLRTAPADATTLSVETDADDLYQKAHRLQATSRGPPA